MCSSDLSMENVTERVVAALKNARSPEAELAARRAAIANLERESQDKTGLRSDVVSLYHGGEYWLYRYKKYTDVRLVFAPEQQIALFGGDPDNFTYPRHDLTPSRGIAAQCPPRTVPCVWNPGSFASSRRTQRH